MRTERGTHRYLVELGEVKSESRSKCECVYIYIWRTAEGSGGEEVENLRLERKTWAVGQPLKPRKVCVMLMWFSCYELFHSRTGRLSFSYLSLDLYRLSHVSMRVIEEILKSELLSWL